MAEGRGGAGRERRRGVGIRVAEGVWLGGKAGWSRRNGECWHTCVSTSVLDGLEVAFHTNMVCLRLLLPFIIPSPSATTHLKHMFSPSSPPVPPFPSLLPICLSYLPSFLTYLPAFLLNLPTCSSLALHHPTLNPPLPPPYPLPHAPAPCASCPSCPCLMPHHAGTAMSASWCATWRS